jgi:hypothetical protein
MNRVTCAVCGAERPSELASGAPMTPCPTCGRETLGVAISARATIRLGGSAAPSLGIDPKRDWRRHWAEVERELAELQTPLSGGMSADAVAAASQRLRAFYVDCFHLKDTLKAEASSIGIAAKVIENVTQQDTQLALLGDLANLSKHSKPPRSPRSGAVPRIVAESATPHPQGWTLALGVEHKGQALDGLQVARDAVDAWRNALNGLGLI